MSHHLVGMQEIAQMLGVSRQRVAQLVGVYEDFPKPEVELAGGRIWSRTAVETWIANHPDRGPGRPEAEDAEAGERRQLSGSIPSIGRGTGLFSRFTDLARNSIVKAQEEARLMGHNYIGTEHMLLGLSAVGNGVAARVLQRLDAPLDVLRARVAEFVEPTSEMPPGHIPFTPRTKTCLELALRESLSLGHNYIGTEHIMLGLLNEGQGLAVKVLEALGQDKMKLRTEIFEELARLPLLPRHAGATRRGGTKPEDIACSFCGKPQSEAIRLIAGPSVYICDECIEQCRTIIEEHRPAADPVQQRLEDLEARLRELEGRGDSEN